MRKSKLDLPTIRELHRAGQLDEAKEGYLAILKKNPHDIEALHWLGILHAQQKNYAEAIHTLEAAIAHQPDNLTLQLHLANVLKMQGLFNQAAQLLLKILSTDSMHVSALNNLGTVYYAQGKLNDAVDAFQKVVDIEPSYVDALYNLGLALSKQNQLNEAIVTYKKLLQLSPEHFAARFHLACALMQKANITDALQEFSLIEISQPHHFETQTNMATCHVKQGDFNQAKIHYLKALNLEPRDTQVLFNLGVINMQQGNVDQAIQNYQRAVHIDPDFFAAQNNLGVAFLAKQHSEFALNHFQETLRLQPKNKSISYVVEMLSKNERLLSAPPDYIKSLFDAYADHYEPHLLNALDYQIPALLKKAILQNKAISPTSIDILDLGCGTGLCGIPFKTFAKTLTGVDLSEKMLEVAAQKNIYDSLSADELAAFLADKKSIYDLIIAGDVFVYLGELSAIFQEASRALRPQGLFAFNTEICTDVDFRMNQSGRFSHQKKYLDQLAQMNGFIILSYQEVVTRLQNNEPVYGHLYVLQIL